MSERSYEESKKFVFKGLWLLAAVTLIEVFISLISKGYLISGLEDIGWLGAIFSLGIIILSLYKAYFIIYEFMHMGGEVRGLRLTVLMPLLLLVWGIIAFFQEGNSWKNSRQKIIDKNAEEVGDDVGLERWEAETYKGLI
ncbi:MAG: cytochrome c oxidase subunit 4 [Paraglaciecola sp.]|jgi:cytochrome c oxidase subunit 4